MKRVFAITFSTLLLSSIAFARVSTMTRYSDTSKAEKEVERIEREGAENMVKGSTATFERYMADNYICIEADGTIVSRADEINMLKSGDLKFQSSTIDDLKVRVYGSTAIVTLRSTDVCTYKGQDESGQYRWTDVYVKLGGSWKWVSTHGCKLTSK